MKVSSKNKLRGKKYIILFSLLIQFTLSSIAQNICLNIRDENNEPVSNAEVIVVNTQLSLFSNKEGIACFNKMDKGQYD